MAGKGAGDWGVVGVSLRSSSVRDVLAAQDFVYTTVAMAPAGMEAPQKIEIINDVLVAPEDPQAVLAVMADPAVRLVNLTVTEKGYCRGAGDQPLDLDDPEVRHDLGLDGAASPTAGPARHPASSCRRWPGGGIGDRAFHFAVAGQSARQWPGVACGRARDG